MEKAPRFPVGGLLVRRSTGSRYKRKRPPFFHPSYRKYYWWGVAVQLVLFQISSLTLDHGMTNWMFLFSSVGYWTGAVLITIRRHHTPTRWDIYYLKYGLILLSFAAALILPLIWS